MDDKKFYETKEFKEAQKEWYSKLEEDGFYDVEGGVEGHMMKGPSPSLRLKYVNKENDRFTPLERREQGDESNLSLEDRFVDFSSRRKARYYFHAQRLATQAVKGGADYETSFAWAQHSQGEGERVIAEWLGVKRGYVRKLIMPLKEQILNILDEEGE